MNGVKITYKVMEGLGVNALIFPSINKCCEYYSGILNKPVRNNNIMHCIMDNEFARIYLNEPQMDSMIYYKPEIHKPKMWYCDVCRMEMLNTSRLNHIDSRHHQINFSEMKNPIVQNMKLDVTGVNPRIPQQI